MFYEERREQAETEILDHALYVRHQHLNDLPLEQLPWSKTVSLFFAYDDDILTIYTGRGYEAYRQEGQTAGEGCSSNCKTVSEGKPITLLTLHPRYRSNSITVRSSNGVKCQRG